MLFSRYGNIIYLMIIPITVSVVILSAIIYLAVSRRSSFHIRIAALVALAAMIITVIICLFRIFMAPASAAARTPPYPDSPPLPPAPPPNTMGLVLFIVILMAMFAVVLYLSLREQRRAATKETVKEDDGLRKLGL